MKPKLLIFHPALAPYRIDQFNSINEIFDLEVVFLFENLWNHKFEQNKLLSQLTCKFSFLLYGPSYKGKVFRFRMLSVIRRINPDLIFGYEYSYTTQYLILLKTLGIISQKIGSTIEDNMDMCLNIQSKIRKLARKIGVNKLDYFVVTSEDVSKYYQNKFNLKEHQLIVSPFLQKIDRLKKDQTLLEKTAKKHVGSLGLNGKKVILFVGRFIPEKALLNFLITIHEVLQEQENLVMLFVGDGEEKNKLEYWISNNDLTKKIIIPGRYEGTELYSWYLCASAFVLPSLHEPYGAVVNEALIFGLPVLCSSYAGASTLVSSDRGLIFDPLNPNETRRKFQVFLKDLKEVDVNKLTIKNSLLPDNQIDFTKQWTKLIND